MSITAKDDDVQLTFEERALQLLGETPLIDGHNDFPYIVRGWHLSDLNSPDFDLRSMPTVHTDLTRLRKGHVGAQVWSAYVPSPAANKTNIFKTEDHYPALLQTLQQIDLIHCMIEKHSKDLCLATTAAEVWEVFRSGRVASLIGVEGLHQIANSASVLRMLHRLGMRYVTLTHSQNNMYADSATATNGACRAGLSTEGFDMVNEMNRIGMIIDLSHTSEETQTQVLNLSKAPVIFSHSSCSTVCHHVRNVTDASLHLLRQNGGIIMISFLPDLTDTTKPTLTKVAEHIVYCGNLIGFKQVGIGSDLDGVMNTVKELHDVSTFPALVEELLRLGFSEEELRGVLGLNFLRVLDEVQRYSAGACLRGDRVLCDAIEPIFDEKLREQMRRRFD